MAIIGFDLDDVLFPLRRVFIETLNQRFDVNIDFKEYDIFGIFAFLYRDHREIYKRIMNEGGPEKHFRYVGESGFLLSTQPYPGVTTLIQQLRKSGKKIGIVTARATAENPHTYYMDGITKTEIWLTRNDIVYDSMKYTHKKAEALKEVEKKLEDKVEIFVEDHPANVVQLVNAGYKVALLDKTYNRRLLLNEAEGDKETYGAGTYTQQDWERVLGSGLVTRINNIEEILGMVKP